MNQRRLQPVDENYLAGRRVYILNFDQLDFVRHATTMEDRGFVVINEGEDRLVDEVDLRVHLGALTVADDIMLPTIWWTSAVAHQLVTIASWLGVGFISEDGSVIETMSARSR